MSDISKTNIEPVTVQWRLSLNRYFREFKYLKWYVFTLATGILICFGTVVVSDQETITRLGDEDQLFEWLTCFFFAAASVFFCLSFFKTRNIWFLILALVFLFGAGEEISWGQRLLGFGTPEAITKINVQKEFNVHNIEIFNNKDLNGNVKHALKKLLDINFLFKIFVMLFGILLPLCVYHIKYISLLTVKLKMPVPPFSLGLFFLLSWFIYQLISIFILQNAPNQCFASFVEIFECSLSFILSVISVYFFKNIRILTIGRDIKQLF